MAGNGRVLVVGGSGFIGSHLATALVDRGAHVVVADVVRSSVAVPGARSVTWDVREPAPDGVLEEALGGVPDVVYNLAAVHRTPGHEDHEYFDTNVPGAEHVTALCERLGATTLVFTSSISVYGPSEEEVVETSPLRPVSAYGQSKAKAEEVHRSWRAREQGRRLVVARPAVVFGPGERGNVTRLAAALKQRRFAYPGRRDTIKAGGHVHDLVRSFEFALGLQRDEITYNYAYPARTTIQDYCEAFHEVGGLPRPVGTVPLQLMLGVGRTFEVLARTGVETGVNRARVMKLVASTNVIPQVLLDEGFTWETDLRSGLARWRDAFPVGSFV